MSIQEPMCELAEIVASLSPRLNPRFRSPASEQEIVAAEAELELPFPAELKSALMCHDGQDFFDPFLGYGDPLVPMIIQPATGQMHSHYWLSGTREIVESTLRYREELAYYDADQFTTNGPTRYHDRFLLVTGGENADGLVLDMLPGPGGVMGQVVIFSTQPTQLVVIAPDWATFLRSLVAEYRQGRFRNQPCNYFVSYGDFS